LRPLPIIQFNTSNEPITWSATSFKELGKAEVDLEEYIANNLATLGLDELARSTYRYQVLRQCQLPRKIGSPIKPDIVVVREDGELFIIEVKLGSNQELFNRKAIGQIMEYASAISDLDKDTLAYMLNDKGQTKTLGELFDHWFAKSVQTHAFRMDPAQALISNIESGKINLLIASDILPSGAYDYIDDLTTKSLLPFNFSAVEITPFKSLNSDLIMLIPQLRIETVIMSRTVVEVKQKAENKSTSINISSVDENEAPISSNRTSKSVKKLTYGTFLTNLSRESSYKWKINRRVGQFDQMYRTVGNHHCILRIFLGTESPKMAIFIEYNRKTPDPLDRIGKSTDVLMAQVPDHLNDHFKMESLDQSWRKAGIFNLALEKDRLDELSYIQEIHQLLSNLNICLPLVNSTQ
jgi:hypothetical protein